MLLATGLCVMVILLAVRFALDPFEQASTWFMAIGLTTGIITLGVIRLRGWRRPWTRADRTIASCFIALILAHCVILWAFIYYLHPDLRMPEWTAISIVEVALLSQVMGLIDERTRRRHAPQADSKSKDR